MKYILVISTLFLCLSCDEDILNDTIDESVISLSGNMDFGSVEVGQNATRTLVIENTGGADFSVSSITNPNGFTSSYSGTVTAGNSVSVTVTFAPTQDQNYNGKLIVNADNDSGIDEINCFGNGIDNNPNPFGTLEVINTIGFSRLFRIKKQFDPNYDPDNQITVDGGQTSYYYNLETGVYLYEADNNQFFLPGNTSYSSGQVNITSGDTATVNILK